MASSTAFGKDRLLRWGHSALDKGSGGKFLLLPLNYTGAIPDGYLLARSKTNRAMFIGRAFVKDSDTKAAADTLAGIKVTRCQKRLHHCKHALCAPVVDH